jgi:hypothetical protein
MRQNPVAMALFRCSANLSLPRFGVGGETFSMMESRHSVTPTHERGLQAVLALFRGGPVA